MKMIADNEVKFVDLRFTDTKARSSTSPVPTKGLSTKKFTRRPCLDGSSIAPGKGSRPPTCCYDPGRPDGSFREENTLC